MIQDDLEETKPDGSLSDLAGWLESNLQIDGHPIGGMLAVHARNKLRRDRALAEHGIEADESCTSIVVKTIARLNRLRDRKVFVAAVGSSVSRDDFLDQCVIALQSISRSQGQ